jgi:hypothetical protein
MEAPFESDWRETIPRAIHTSGRQFVIALTGGGSGAIAQLLQTPGASRSVLEAIVPYALPALADWLGGVPDQACSAPAARAMAMAALERARMLAPDADVKSLLGVGCTASLVTDRPKRGPRRVHVAVQSSVTTRSLRLDLIDENPRRDRDEACATKLMLAAIAEACGVNAAALWNELPTASGAESFCDESASSPSVATELALRKRRLAVLKPHSIDEFFTEPDMPPIAAVFPGAFNPVHDGHRRMASIAQQRLGQPVTWEVSLANVDKPPLDFIALRDRIAGLRADDAARPVALTMAPTFREKAELFPGAAFVVGADTLARIADPKYYGGDAQRRDEAVAHIAGQGCRFLVFGRESGGQFQTLAELNLPPALRTLCKEVPAADFRADVSSTNLRASAEPN